MAKRKKAKATKKATKAAKAKATARAAVAKVARDLGMTEDEVREAALAAKAKKAAAGEALDDATKFEMGLARAAAAEGMVAPARGLEIDFGKPLEPQADRLAGLLVQKLPTEFALLPEADYVTNPNAPPEALQPGFVALPAPILDKFDDGSGMEWHGAAIIDGQLVFQGRRRERAATSRVLGMAKGRSFTAMLQDEQKRVGERPTPVPADSDAEATKAAATPPTGGTSLATLEQAGLAKAGSPLEGRFFRLPTTTDGGGVERVREIAEFVILSSLGLYASTRMANVLMRSSIDADKDGKEVERADRKVEPLYPGGSGAGLY